MRRLSLALIAAVSTVALTQIASATDLSVKAPVYKAPVTNWEGFYVGGHVGYGWDPADATFDPVTYVTTVDPAFTATSSSGPVNLSVAPEGWLGGVQLGYNWQQNFWVYGLEADFSWSDIKDSDSAPWFVNGTLFNRGAGNVTGIVSLEQKLDYFGTVRGRLGWANNALLLYGTGGLAWGHVVTTFRNYDINAVGGLFTAAEIAALQAGGHASASDIRWGFTVGAGLEWMFAPHWSAKAEYLFVDLLGSDTLSIIGGVATAGDLRLNVVRVGVNYLFH